MKDNMLVNHFTSLQEIEINLKVIISVKIAVIFSLFLRLLTACLALKSFSNKYSYTFQSLCNVDYLPSV